MNCLAMLTDFHAMWRLRLDHSAVVVLCFHCTHEPYSPTVLVRRSEKPLLETGFTLIGLANCVVVVRSAQAFLICTPWFFGIILKYSRKIYIKMVTTMS
jgi:hypothetical protein